MMSPKPFTQFQGKIKNAEDKKQFPVLVNNVAFVKKKTENGEEIKYTYLRKQFKLGTVFKCI